MKIRRFVGRSVAGYLNFDISFFDHVTFVTGINGSGKTSALNSIAALLLPRLDYLASQEFAEIALELTDDQGASHTLSAKKTESSTEITCSSVRDEVLILTETADLDSVPPHRAQEYEEGYLADVLSRNRDNPVLNFIESLPTPMYPRLGPTFIISRAGSVPLHVQTPEGFARPTEYLRSFVGSGFARSVNVCSRSIPTRSPTRACLRREFSKDALFGVN